MSDLEERNKRLSALRKVDEIMMSRAMTLADAAQQVTNAVAFELGFEIGVLSLIDKQKGVLKRVAMSNTLTGIEAKKTLPIPYEHLEIPLTADGNYMIKAIKENKKQVTHDLHDVFTPVFDKEMSLKIQETVNVKTSLIYPVCVREEPIGALIVSVARQEEELSSYELESIEDLVDVMGIALGNAMLYESLQQTTEQLAEANLKLKELDQKKDEFVSVASHELRTPMTAIRSYIWLALAGKGGELTEKQKYYLERSYTSTVRLIKLVNDMLNISRIESGRIQLDMAEVDMAKLVEEVIGEVKPKADELKINLVAKNETKLPTVLADSDKIKEVLINFIGNSLKFTPANGTITVWSELENNMVKTFVSDTGHGIATEDMSKLFQKFSLVSGSYVVNQNASIGTGLGLYICKNIVELQGGQIGVQSDGVDKGAIFNFTLKIFNQNDLEEFKKKYEGKEGLGIIHTTLD